MLVTKHKKITKPVTKVSSNQCKKINTKIVIVLTNLKAKCFVKTLSYKL